MTATRKLEITTPSAREMAMTRAFDAPRELVWKALTTPALLQRWLTGMPGWILEVCEVDLRVGGAYRFVWRQESGDRATMGMGGEYREVAAPVRYAATELFDEPWYPGEALVTTELEADGDRTILTTTVLYASEEARDGVLASGAATGVDLSYDRLDGVLADEVKRDG